MPNKAARDTAADVDARREGARSAAAQEKQRILQLREREAGLATHDAWVREHEQAITAAKQVLAGHRAALKGAGKDREALAGEVKKARKASEKASRKARRAEVAYDDAVLATLVEREKDADRLAHQTAAFVGSPDVGGGPIVGAVAGVDVGDGGAVPVGATVGGEPVARP